jgi:hypothetical protein
LFLVQARKKGFAVAQVSVRVVDGLERDYAMRLSPIGRSRYTAEMAEVVAKEASQRQGFRTGHAMIVGRDELEKFGKTRLHLALASSSAATAYKQTPAQCAIVNGFDLATTGGTGGLERPTRPPRGVRSIHTEGQAVLNRAATPMPSSPGLAPPGSWVSFLRSDEVELVEIYPEGSENSRTLCGRFTRSSGCSCPPDPAGIVIWLR